MEKNNKKQVGYMSDEYKDNISVEFTGIDRGFVSSDSQVLTFEIQGICEREDIRQREYQSIYSRYASERMSLQLQGGYVVPMWGEGHNLYPQEVYSVTSENKLLPKVIKKQVEFLFGKGPRIYKEIIKGEEENQRRVRIPVEDKKIQDWLESWEAKGYENYWQYLINIITDYYYVKTCISKYHFNRGGRRLGRSEPIDALVYVGADEARLAARGDFLNKRIKESDCKYVIQGDWMNLSGTQYDVFHRFSPAEPLKYPITISFNTEKTFTKWVYTYNDWFKGLYEWIKASNLTPRYLNSYLKNALNAHVHVIIPGTWYNQQVTILTSICRNNIENMPDRKIVTEYHGVPLVDNSGKPYRFSEDMVEDVVRNELRKITQMMAGEGKNQGKLYATTKWGDEGWEFKEFPSKFKEFFESNISYDKRADQVILAGIGMPPAITNVEKDGVISNSGSNVYYNYLLYVNTLTMAEYYTTLDINRAIQINFPYTKEQGIKIGFWIDIPAKQQETTPADRLVNTATTEPSN